RLVVRRRHVRFTAARKHPGRQPERRQSRGDAAGSIAVIRVDPQTTMKLLVTGGAGFIGSSFVRYVLRTQPEVDIVNFDLLTYAGNLRNLDEVRSEERRV